MTRGGYARKGDRQELAIDIRRLLGSVTERRAHSEGKEQKCGREAPLWKQRETIDYIGTEN